MSEGKGWLQYKHKDDTLRFYLLVNPAREIEVEARGDEICIKHHGKELLVLCKDEARKLGKALDLVTENLS